MIFDDPNQENWNNLANAIVLSAVKDFRRAYKKYLKNPEDKAVADEVASLINFFTGEYFLLFTFVDGGYIVRKLKEEVEKKVEAEKIKTQKKKKKSAQMSELYDVTSSVSGSASDAKIIICPENT